MKKWPNTIGSCMHELLHAIGFYHEHCRPDRDEHVIVKRSGKNYEKLENSKVLCHGPYDKLSIMHYSNKQGVESRSGKVKMGLYLRFYYSFYLFSCCLR